MSAITIKRECDNGAITNALLYLWKTIGITGVLKRYVFVIQKVRINADYTT